MFFSTFFVALTAVTSVAARRGGKPWSQCGGRRFRGIKTCPSGYSCKKYDRWYSQCVPLEEGAYTMGTTTATNGLATTATTATTMPTLLTNERLAVVDDSEASGSVTAGATTTTTGLTLNTDLSLNRLAVVDDDDEITDPSGTAGATATTATTTATTNTGLSIPTGGTVALAQNEEEVNTTTTSGSGYKATFSRYAGCASRTACGDGKSDGFIAAGSQNMYGITGTQFATQGHACGTCWKLTVQTTVQGDTADKAGTSIVVMMEDLCPLGGDVCTQTSLTDTNQYGANVNIDLCEDSGTDVALFGDGPQRIDAGVFLGTAEEVSCDLWIQN